MQEIFDAIDQYAEAYGRLEQLQRSRPKEIPIGDQKTGVIAEFFARIYARHRFPKATFEFGSASEHAWDIKVLQDGQPEIKVQVKAVSAHSQTSRVSPIHPGWHQLWLMRLDEHLRPQALWVVEAQKAAWSKTLLKNRTMPKLGKPQSGSAELRGGANETAPFLAALVSANQSFQRTVKKLRFLPSAEFTRSAGEEMRVIEENYERITDDRRSFDIHFWQSQGDRAIFEAVSGMLRDYFLIRGKDADEFRLQRTVESFRKA